MFALNASILDLPVSPDRSYSFTFVSSFVRSFVPSLARPLVKSFSQNWLIIIFFFV